MSNGEPKRRLPLPLGNGKLLIKQGESGEIRWQCRDMYQWELEYSYESDADYRLAISCEHHVLFSDLDLGKMFVTIMRLIESGTSDGRKPMGLRLEVGATFT
jgi:hypothetical protein